MGEYIDAPTNSDATQTEVERLRAQNAELLALVEQLRQRVAELEARLNKDSHNSNKPPSSDSPFKKPPPRSQRQSASRAGSRATRAPRASWSKTPRSMSSYR